jgi:hypothetical protein
MSIEDVKQDEFDSEELDNQQEATPVENEEDAEAVAADAEESDEGEEEWEVVERILEPSQDDERKRNKAFAKQRIEAREAKRKAEELERKLKEIESGNIPETLREQLSGKVKLPEQPKYEDFFGDVALAKYEYDTTRAQAAFNAAMGKWQLDALDARAANEVSSVQARQQYIQQERQRLDAVRKYEDAVSKMRIAGFDDAERQLNDTVKQITGAEADVNVIIAQKFGDDAKTAVAVVNYLGRNPEEVRRILAMSPTEQDREIYRIGYQKLEARQKTVKRKPEADTPLSNGGSSREPNWKKELGKMLENNDPNFRARKKEVEAKLGRSISSFELLY